MATGRFFCDVCDHWFFSESKDDKAVCSGCGEDVLDTSTNPPERVIRSTDELFGLDSYSDYEDDL
jgi:hypothetical protein